MLHKIWHQDISHSVKFPVRSPKISLAARNGSKAEDLSSVSSNQMNQLPGAHNSARGGPGTKSKARMSEPEPEFHSSLLHHHAPVSEPQDLNLDTLCNKKIQMVRGGCIRGNIQRMLFPRTGQTLPHKLPH
ncbi:hypothetical protein M758_12G055000 [Ceratodon purpureus]|uniref:Uncharacterized protein n=1 Tax=Ceratodon purpureus TaxID=3225 RepID=A0A8T0G692_CERPU|nr:hypothetical protein KC19_12G052400 [Ceratodon purpureus]KAG0598210.1 hypothetical protein M758_12G055000 [Ceratodon purpureus]